MTIQHKDIPDAQLHEPKGVASASSKQIYVANGAGSGAWRKIKESDLDFTTAVDNKFGWNYRADNQYLVGSPLAVPANTKTLLTNNGLGSLTNTTRPLNITYSNDGFIPTTLNSSYIMRLAMKVKAAAAAGTPYVAKLTLEGGPTPLTFTAQDVFIKGGNYENSIALSFLFFTGALNTNNIIKAYITADTAVSVYDIDYLIQRTYLEV